MNIELAFEIEMSRLLYAASQSRLNVEQGLVFSNHYKWQITKLYFQHTRIFEITFTNSPGEGFQNTFTT